MIDDRNHLGSSAGRPDPDRPTGNATRAPLPWRRLSIALLLFLGAMASAHAQIGAGSHGRRQKNQQETPQQSPAPTTPSLP